MYLLLIFLIILVIPFAVVPRHIKINILPPYRIVLYSTLTVASLAALIFMIAAFSGEGLYSQLYAVVKLMSEQLASEPMFVETFRMTEMSDTERINAVLHIYDSGLKRLPVTIMFMGMVVSYIAYIIISRIMSKKHDVKKMPKFREFTFPHGAAMAVMIMYLISWIMMTSEASVGEILYMNVNMLFDLVFVIQGIAVVFMFFYFKRVPQTVSVIVSGIMWMTAIGETFLVLLGMADLFLGVRGWIAAKNGR